MGKKLDALLGRAFKPSKFKSLISLAISRLAVFKNKHQSRCNQARSDVVQMLELGQHDRALLRVEQVIKEQNMLDVFVMLEGYCNLVIERVHLIEQDRVCPDELQEAISGLLFASSRCGDFPELQEIRGVFMSRYGKEFAARAIELRNNCGVNTKIIQKLSTRQPDLKSRRDVLKEIAAENGIALQFEETSGSSEENLDGSKKQSQPKLDTSAKAGGIGGDDDEFTDSMKGRKKYRDVADAAQAAFESAAYAAAAARAAVELSRSDSHDPDDQNSPNSQGKRVSDRHESNSKYKQTHPGGQAEGLNQSKKTPEISSPSSEGSAEGTLDLRTMSLDEVDPIKLLEKEVVIHESDDETYDSYDLSFDMNTRKLKNKVQDTDKDDEPSEKTGLTFQYSSNKQIPSSLRAGLKVETETENPTAHAAKSSETKGKQHFTINKGPFSVRTRQVRGY
ncbi:Vacuolar protein sorting-associated protein Ist1 - like 3 [Theobroma cacao]|nr:Vacuolar protein sorting-associated protein Ist1 - like 3 [Theobroma cacao]